MPKSKLFYGKRRRFTGNQHTGPIAVPTKQPGAVKKSRSFRQNDQTVERGSYMGESAVSGFELRNVTEVVQCYYALQTQTVEGVL